MTMLCTFAPVRAFQLPHGSVGPRNPVSPVFGPTHWSATGEPVGPSALEMSKKTVPAGATPLPTAGRAQFAVPVTPAPSHGSTASAIRRGYVM